MASWPYWTSGLALLAGAGMGLWGLLNPRWAADLVRLQESPAKPGGFAEFRGTYGGLFLASHGVALASFAARLHGGDPTLASLAPGAVAACAAMWLGTAVGRVLSMVRDGTGTKYNQASVLFEIGLGLAILAPLLVHRGAFH